MADRERAVLITGASRGIGEACALRLAAAGMQVFAGVRRDEDAAALRTKSDRIVPVRIDVSDANTIRAAAALLSDHTGDRGLTGLVNNAGIAVAGPLEFLPLDALRRQLEVNVIGQVAVAQAVLPLLRRARGRIVFVSSIAGRSALPFIAPYAASKHALEAIADSLRVELLPWGIDVVVVEPGVIATPIWETSLEAAEKTLADAPPQMLELYGEQLDAVRRAVTRTRGLPPDAVARVIEHALTTTHPGARYVVGMDARFRLLLERLPDRVRDRIIAWQLRRL